MGPARLAPRTVASLLGLLLGVSVITVARAETQTAMRVQFIDASKPTRCAEEDNVYVKLEGAGVRSFSLSVEHPPYITAVTTDRKSVV